MARAKKPGPRDFGFFQDDADLVEACDRIRELMAESGEIEKERRAAIQGWDRSRGPTDEVVKPIDEKLDPITEEIARLRKEIDPHARRALQRFLSSHAERRLELFGFIRQAVEELQAAIAAEQNYRDNLTAEIQTLPIDIGTGVLPSNLIEWIPGMHADSLQNSFYSRLNELISQTERQAGRKKQFAK